MVLSWKQVLMVTGLATVLLAFLAPAIDAHEKGVLKLTTRQLAPGDSMGAVGQHFGRRTALMIEIVGMAGRRRLAGVRTDSAGAFDRTLVVPLDLPPGAYRLVVIAPDGDEVASADVALGAGVAPTTRAQVSDEGKPSARPLALIRARSAWVTSGTLALIGLALAGGAALLFLAPRRAPESGRGVDGAKARS